MPEEEKEYIEPPMELETIQSDIAAIVLEEPLIIEEPDPLEGKLPHPLTGIYIDEHLITRRPMAIVINNLRQALPQSGISTADIMYEVVAEGGITRLIAIMTDNTATRIGPIRSTRDYFTNFALDNRAVLVHHGGSPTGYNAIRSLGLNNLDGMHLEGSRFFRDRTRIMEHSSFTSGPQLAMEMINRNMDLHIMPSYALSPFDFFEEPTAPYGASSAFAVNIPFSNWQNSRFVYDTEKGVFWRYQNGEPHIDEYIDEQLSTINIIIQRTNQHLVLGDAEGRIHVELVGSGDGYLFTQGVYKPITWSKLSPEEPTNWFTEDGDRLTINPGNTWIVIVSNTIVLDIESERPEILDASTDAYSLGLLEYEGSAD